MDKISTFISTYFDWFYITVPGTVDIIEILILSFFIYDHVVVQAEQSMDSSEGYSYDRALHCHCGGVPVQYDLISA